MNVAVIFAGGTGQRMQTKTKPKQFLELHNKPIIIYTLEQFEYTKEIDGIIVVCLSEWIEYCSKLINKFGISKVVDIISGGDTGFQSRYLGLKRAAELYDENTIILMHDGVRPLIDSDTIVADINCVKKNGSAITVSAASETIAVKANGDTVGEILDRSQCQLAKAPQCFYLGELLKAHEIAIKNGMKDCIDCAFLMQSQGHSIFSVEGNPENIKITTPTDFYIFRAIIDARENSQIFG